MSGRRRGGYGKGGVDALYADGSALHGVTVAVNATGSSELVHPAGIYPGAKVRTERGVIAVVVQVSDGRAFCRTPHATGWFDVGTLAPIEGCRHCGQTSDPDGDHSCPCPHSDEDCPDHPNRRRCDND